MIPVCKTVAKSGVKNTSKTGYESVYNIWKIWRGRVYSFICQARSHDLHYCAIAMRDHAISCFFRGFRDFFTVFSALT